MANYSSPHIDALTQERYKLAGFGGSLGIGKEPALLIIDVQYRTSGTKSVPFEEAIKEFSTAVGEEAWKAIANIKELLAVFRSNGWPVLYPYVAPKKGFDKGALGEKNPGIMTIAERGYDFVDEVAPEPGEILLPKRHPSAFYGTPLASYLIQAGVDSLVVVGCSTSGCVRSTVVDAFSYNYRVMVPSDACYDRSDLVHAVNLFDMDQKYADVAPTRQFVDRLSAAADTVKQPVSG